MDIHWLPATLSTQAILLVVSFMLSGIIGLERELRQKSAGTRTHILIGMGSALFTLVSSYGFEQLLNDEIVLDPSRIAAQIVTGIGFFGAGVIFVRRNTVSGLTTAASIWVTASVGMACGAGMPFIAALTVALYLFAVTVLTALVRRLPTHERSELYRVRYRDGQGVLRSVLEVATDSGYETSLLETRGERVNNESVVEVKIEFTHGKQRPLVSLMERISEVPGVVEVLTEDQDHD